MSSRAQIRDPPFSPGLWPFSGMSGELVSIYHGPISEILVIDIGLPDGTKRRVEGYRGSDITVYPASENVRVQ